MRAVMETADHRKSNDGARRRDAEGVSIEPRSALWAAIVSVVRPGLGAARSRGASLGRVWFVFLASLVFGVAVVVLVAAGFNVAEVTLPAYADEVRSITFDIAKVFSRDPSMFVLNALAAFAGLHLAAGLLAAIVMPIGARDEPLRTSFIHALRQVWLSVVRLALLVLVIGLAAGMLDRVDRTWWRMNPRPARPIRPVMPNEADYPDDKVAYAESVAEYEQAKVQYEQDRQRYRQAHRHWSASRPWFVQNWEALIALSSVSAAMWHLCMLAAALSVRRDPSCEPRPPTCEFCGYNLMATPPDSRCPECGTPALASLGPDVRSGPPWEHRQELGSRTAFWRTARSALASPTALGRTLQVGSGRYACQQFALICLPGFFGVGTLALTTTILSQATFDEIESELPMIIPMIIVFGIACAVGACVVGQVTASVVGIICSVRQGRNLLPPAQQSACYLFGFLLVWEAVGALLGMGVMELATSGVLEVWERTTPISADAWAISADAWAAIIWIPPNVGMGVAFVVMVYRATNAARYANR